MYKIFSGVIDQRLYDWAEENNKIDESQAGFRHGYSEIDNIFCLQAMIQKYLTKSGGRFYCLYVDFRKAFDKINHSKLFECLERKGIHGRFLLVLKAMYQNLNSCVKMSKSNNSRGNVQNVNAITDMFPCNIGTRQGDKSSSTIFALFIDELSSLLREQCGSGIFITNQIPDIHCLIFADDIANCAETVQKLQRQLHCIDLYCQNTGMEVNLDKTEVIVFRNGGILRNTESWQYRGTQVRTTAVYKYMGVLFTPSLSWNLAHNKLAAQAQKAILSLYRY